MNQPCTRAVLFLTISGLALAGCVGPPAKSEKKVEPARHEVMSWAEAEEYCAPRAVDIEIIGQDSGDLRIRYGPHYAVAIYELDNPNPINIVLQRDAKQIKTILTPARKGET